MCTNVNRMMCYPMATLCLYWIGLIAFDLIPSASWIQSSAAAINSRLAIDLDAPIAMAVIGIAIVAAVDIAAAFLAKRREIKFPLFVASASPPHHPSLNTNEAIYSTPPGNDVNW